MKTKTNKTILQRLYFRFSQNRERERSMKILHWVTWFCTRGIILDQTDPYEYETWKWPFCVEINLLAHHMHEGRASEKKKSRGFAVIQRSTTLLTGAPGRAFEDTSCPSDGKQNSATPTARDLGANGKVCPKIKPLVLHFCLLQFLRALAFKY